MEGAVNEILLKTHSPARNTRKCYGKNDIEHSLRLSLTANMEMLRADAIITVGAQ